MTIVQCLNSLSDWLKDNVCSKILFKCPSDDRQATDYDFELVHPQSFAMFIPGTDKLPPGVKSECPCVTVQLMDGSDNLLKSNSSLNVRLCFLVWNPGVHPDENGMTEGYRRSADGWQDVWSFLERAVNDIENAQYINGMRLRVENGVQYGQFSKDGQVAEMYPYFYAWATMTFERGIARPSAACSQFL